jgi:hypothetical protein
MTIRYVNPSGSNTAPYDTWAKGATSFQTVAALTGVNDITYVSNALNQTFGATQTIILNGACYSTSDTTNMPPTSIAAGATLSGGAGSFSLNFYGSHYIYGMTFNGGTTATGRVTLNQSPGNCSYENCTVNILTTNGGYQCAVGLLSTIAAVLTKTIGCTFTMGNSSGQGIGIANSWEDIGSTFGITTTAPTNYFNMTAGGFGTATFYGSDLSAITTTLVGSSGTAQLVTFNQCKFGAGVAPAASGAYTPVIVNDCNAGNVHYTFGHYAANGSTTVSAAIYQNNTDGANYDVAGDKYSWKITGLAAATFINPYVSPWITRYNEATSAVTPRIEILRDGSATAYNNDQVWAEYANKVTASSTRATIVNNKRGLVAAAAAIPNSSLTSSNWTGQGGTAWFGKLEPASTVTPAVIGDMMARISVVGAITVYVNPAILGV